MDNNWKNLFLIIKLFILFRVLKKIFLNAIRSQKLALTRWGAVDHIWKSCGKAILYRISWNFLIIKYKNHFYLQIKTFILFKREDKWMLYQADLSYNWSWAWWTLFIVWFQCPKFDLLDLRIKKRIFQFYCVGFIYLFFFFLKTKFFFS